MEMKSDKDDVEVILVQKTKIPIEVVVISSSSSSSEGKLSYDGSVASISSKGYEVEDILDWKLNNGVPTFLVKWKNCLESDSSWEPLPCLDNCDELLKEFFVREQGMNLSPETSSSTCTTLLADCLRDGVAIDNSIFLAQVENELQQKGLNKEMKQYLKAISKIFDESLEIDMDDKQHLLVLINNDLEKDGSSIVPFKILATRANWTNNGCNVHLVRLKPADDGELDMVAQHPFYNATKDNLVILTTDQLVECNPEMLALYYDKNIICLK